MLLDIGNKTGICIGEARDYFQNQTGVKNRRPNVCKLIREEFEMVTVGFGRGKVLKIYVAKLVTVCFCRVVDHKDRGENIL